MNQNNIDFLKFVKKEYTNIIKSLPYSLETIQHMTISANVMVKDEEKYVQRCIDSVVEYVDEINVVDTGSVDRTLSILEKLKHNYKSLNVYRFLWNEDFSEVRNYMLSISTSDVIFMIDADESLSHNFSVSEFREFINLVFSSEIDNILLSPTLYDLDGSYCDRLARIFRNDSSIYYFGCVHEELRSQVYKNFEIISTNITLFHNGYESEQIILKDKVNRNIRLLKKTIIIEEDNYRWYFFMMRDLYSSKATEEELLKIAYICLKKMKSLCKNVTEYRKQSYIYIALIYLKYEKFKELITVIELMFSWYPGDIDCFYIKLKSIKTFLKYTIMNLLSEYNQIDFNKECHSILNIKFDVIVLELFWLMFYTKQDETGFLLISDLDEKNKLNILQDIQKLIDSIEKSIQKYKDPDSYFKNILNKNCKFDS